MKRRNWVLLSMVLLLVAAILAPAVAQEPSRPKTLAERLSSLRFGWRTSAKEEAAKEKAPAKPKASSKTSAPQATPPATRPAAPPRVGSKTASRSRSVPRVDPRSLLPKEFQGPNTVARSAASKDLLKEAAAVETAPPKVGNNSPARGTLGSVRARILRDLRQQGDTTITDELVGPGKQPPASPAPPRQLANASTTSARAGSVLSKQPSSEPEPSDFSSVTGQLRERIRPQALSSDFQRQSTVSANRRSTKPASTPSKTSVSKSIAAEVAQRMAAQADLPAKPEPANEKVVTPSVAAAPVATPIETSKPEPVVATPIKPLAKKTVESTPKVAAAPKTVAPPEVIVPVPAPTVEPEPVATAAKAQGPTTRLSQGPTRIALETGRASVPKPIEATPVVTLDTAPSASSDQAALRSSFGGDAKQSTGVISGRIGNSVPSRGDNVLITQTAPQVAARVLGPKQVVIGREAKFQVKMTNRGAAAARELETRVQVPEWAEVASVATTSGRIDSPTMSDAGRILWRIDRFAAGGEETMDMTLVARSGRPVEVAVDWTHAPVSSRALVEVQEPKLKMHIAGPEEVYFGKAQLFRLTMSNPGTGVAEDVSLLLAPPGKPIEEATRHAIGDLRPGATKSVEIELTAREAGQLALAARAMAAGGVEAGVDKQVFCRKPEIEVDWRGPAEKYTGALSTYYFRVRNSGTAVAEAVTFNVTLPPGFEMTSASDGQSYDRRSRQLSWRVGSLRPGDDYYMELKGVAQTAGSKDFKVVATTGDKLVSDSVNAVTKAIAVADLKLDVRDPKGPLPVGADAVYEVRVTNRGSNVAESVDVVALFSGGIEPLSVEGHHCELADGRVSLPTIDRLPAGGEVVLRIHARAVEAGTHIFRAEVACRDLEIRLAAEEMTRFYNDDAGLPRAAAADRFSSPR